MATSMLEGKHEVKEMFTLLESQEIQDSEGIKTLIQENLSANRDSWLVHSLVDYYYLTQSTSVVSIFCGLSDPHDKHLLEKLYEGIKSSEHQLLALQLLLLIVCKQPMWIAKVVSLSVLKVIIKTLKVETNIPILMTGVTIVTILLPSVPASVGPYLPDIFEVFNRLASFTIKKPPGNTPDIFYLHLQIAVYALFHRLYGMYPYNFLTYLRHFYSKKENTMVFEEVIKCMLERVRLHPQLIIGNKDQETSMQRWRQMETHDVVAECSRMSLDAVEGTWEELQCPIISSRYLIDRSTTNQMSSMDTGPPIIAPLASVPVISAQGVSEFSPGAQGQDVFWSPSEVIGLSTPPASQRVTPASVLLESSGGSTATATTGPSLVVNATTTPMNTPRETPPISEETDRTMSRMTSRSGLLSSRGHDPKRLSTELTIPTSVPLLTPSSHVASVPPSPLKAEFTNTPPFGVKTLPVLHASRELQFEQDQSDERPIKNLLKLSQSQAEAKNLNLKTDQSDCRTTPIMEKAGKSDSKQTAQGGILQVGTASADTSKTPSRSSSVTFFEDSIKTTSKELEESFDNAVKEQDMKSRAMSDVSESSQQDTVSIDNISQVIDSLDSQDEDDDDEVSELTSNSRSPTTSYPSNITAESVKLFMKSVNRIRFNSLTATNNVKPEKQRKKFGGKHRSRSCPQFPKIDAMSEEEEEELSRSASTMNACNTGDEVSLDLSDQTLADVTSGIADDDNIDFSARPQTTNDGSSLQDISITSTNSTVTVNNKEETTVTITSTTTTQSSVTVTKCPIYGNRQESSKDGAQTTENELVRILRQVLNLPAADVCSKCQGHKDATEAGSSRPFFTTFSPPELLDRHIILGRDIHAKELSKIPMPSMQEVNWTHFGGVPPADEISILRGQLMLIHNQLMYERHKRDQHANRNRRLLRKIANTKTLEEQNKAMKDQLKQQEVMVRDLHVSVKLLQEDNRKLRSARDSEEYEKLVQLKSCLQENEDLKNIKKELNMLLIRQREEQDNLKKKQMSTESKLFNASNELEKTREVALVNTKLKEQVIHLQKELLLMGELQQKCSEKLLTTKSSKATHLEHEHLKNTLNKQIKELRQEVSVKTVQLEAMTEQLKEQHETLLNRDSALTDLKQLVDKIKASHEDELKIVEEKYQSAMRVNQSLEAHILELHADMECLRAKISKGGGSKRISSGHEASCHDDATNSGVHEFRERTSSDPLQQNPSLKKKTLTRMTSLPAEHVPLNDSSRNDLDPNTPRSSRVGHQGQRSQIQGQSGASAQFSDKMTVLSHAECIEEDFEVLDDGRESNDATRRPGDASETVSVASRDSTLFPGQPHLMYTDSEDSRSLSTNRSNIGDSGFC